MKKQFILTLFALIVIAFPQKAFSQSLPSGTAGIVYTYDAAGNRTKVEYIVNNTSTTANVVDSQKIAVAKVSSNVLKVDVLYPNPTTGRFTVRLVKPLQNANVTIVDVSGRTVIKSVENGSLLTYDLSKQPSGIYLLYIQQQDQKITLKILKK
ncbi:hypothetical protein A9P82_12980 [Arachidicoccus ginsenosidimutans]|uniref:T9SS type A sorting domain-containing protein n=1 Tax=Arachidicoccus sp. BS20 TaxID=1850526 RepID=UPI0007F0F90F|nr:T9SS type A sorting domain-containing protein [Arachidicoccus sp. BS20]ANI90116.1 hypothetical protein A9P82_12980 [Arachidicoccus sp. BS20]